jgi:hypothetical protein
MNKQRLAEGHIHGFLQLNMAVGQNTPLAFRSWGVAPGYDERWPSANF